MIFHLIIKTVHSLSFLVNKHITNSSITLVIIAQTFKKLLSIWESFSNNTELAPGSSYFQGLKFSWLGHKHGIPPKFYTWKCQVFFQYLGVKRVRLCEDFLCLPEDLKQTASECILHSKELWPSISFILIFPALCSGQAQFFLYIFLQILCQEGWDSASHPFYPWYHFSMEPGNTKK